MSLDSWLTTTPEDKAHPTECNCGVCHAIHVEEAYVVDNAMSPDFLCCEDQMELDIQSGDRCRMHPKAFCENRDCEECDIEKKLRETN